MIGIVAGRIKDKYHRPTAVFAQADNGDLKGSCRSIPGVHIRDILESVDAQYPGVIKKFGGHAMAAGLSIEADRFDTFKLAFEKTIERQITDEQRTCSILTDGELPGELFSLDFALLLRQSGPWGQGFEAPVFEGEFKVVTQKIVGEKHLKLMLQHESGLALDGIHFNCDMAVWPNGSIRTVKAAYTLDINEFRNQVNVQLLIQALQVL